ncbi:Uridine kinase [Quadrisphaera granulorum]|uniref:Uridine kinase n=1 Tax=Quadrisphaera granulorum TaxID=317664 RepID=A0A316A0Y8_9ACTN|nr:(d)CMP kinase [Quadrisphaera granulorum]PWJ51192.1 uridine kinase [Quadrisphaera granulorum]SZE97842.1 Uridine kinase [Quadrisphaera granulorum]
MPELTDPAAADIAERVVELVLGRPAGPGGVRVLAIDGPSGSGKTTLAGVVATALRARGVSTTEVHMDDLYPGWDGLAESVGLVTAQVLEPLTAGTPAAFRRWDWVAHTWAEQVPVPAAAVVVLEGVGCGSRPCAPHLTALVWVEADDDERMRRGIERDGEAYRPHWERWAAQERVLFAAEGTRERADLLLRT